MAPTSHIIVQVSKYWRNVAKGTPQVWDHWVILNSYSKAGIEGKLEKLFPAMLNLYGRNLTRVYYCSTRSTKFLAPLLHTGQYTCLRIAGSVDKIRDVQGAQDMPLLEELLISDGDSSADSSPIVFNTPKLKRLSLHSSANVLSRFILPWYQITYFSYGPSYPLSNTGKIAPNVLQVLQGLPNLTYLHLMQSDSILLGQHVTLSNLRTFEIHDYELSLLGRQPLLHYLRAPLLERFDLVIPGETTTRSVEPYTHASQQLAPFLQTSSCLQRIRIAVIFGRQGLTYLDHQPRKTPESIYIWGTAPVFHELPSKILPNGYIPKELGYVKVLDSPKAVSVRDFVTLDRYIDRFMECEDSSSRYIDTPAEPMDAVIDPYYAHPRVQVLWDFLSGFTANDLNMDFYLQMF
ncbi:hypothetical protein EST38_g3780 [Candolleomyces aberdarensis]|uniref:F-box domain-containing protein n=1 Tax=Candolleomyces aberdarensis TaxID=2316362 RepID=A0A4Q2DPP9_9AGAR|nr:hypothetical protein EST38_g3780 [Candolleomyces aberdarensis]